MTVLTTPVPDMAAFDWRDPFFLDSQLSAEERMIQASAAAFAQAELAPRVQDMYENEGIAPELFALMG